MPRSRRSSRRRGRRPGHRLALPRSHRGHQPRRLLSSRTRCRACSAVGCSGEPTPALGRLRVRGQRGRAEAGEQQLGQLLEKLSGFGIELDRAGLEVLCQGAFSTQEVAAQLTGRYLTDAQTRAPESDWVWLAVLTLWQRWWPAKPHLETLDDKIQDGYPALRKDLAAATDRYTSGPRPRSPQQGTGSQRTPKTSQATSRNQPPARRHRPMQQCPLTLRASVLGLRRVM